MYRIGSGEFFLQYEKLWEQLTRFGPECIKRSEETREHLIGHQNVILLVFEAVALAFDKLSLSFDDIFLK